MRTVNYEEALHKEYVLSWIKPEEAKWGYSDLVDSSKPQYILIMLLDDGTPVGALEVFNIDRENKKCEYGAILGDKKGAFGARKLIKGVFTSLFEEGFNRIYTKTTRLNPVIFKINTFLGFTLEGVERQAVRVNDRFEDRLIMGLLKEDFERKCLTNGISRTSSTGGWRNNGAVKPLPTSAAATTAATSD